MNYCICNFRKQPTLEHECWEAIWSQGGACKSCQVDCYRRGWSKEQATTDNKRLVTARRAR